VTIPTQCIRARKLVTDPGRGATPSTCRPQRQIGAARWLLEVAQVVCVEGFGTRSMGTGVEASKWLDVIDTVRAAGPDDDHAMPVGEAIIALQSCSALSNRSSSVEIHHREPPRDDRNPE
jgi:hypothetical protein